MDDLRCSKARSIDIALEFLSQRSRGTTNFRLDSRLSAAVSPLRGLFESRQILRHNSADGFVLAPI